MRGITYIAYLLCFFLAGAAAIFALAQMPPAHHGHDDIQIDTRNAWMWTFEVRDTTKAQCMTHCDALILLQRKVDDALFKECFPWYEGSEIELYRYDTDIDTCDEK